MQFGKGILENELEIGTYRFAGQPKIQMHFPLAEGVQDSVFQTFPPL